MRRSGEGEVAIPAYEALRGPEVLETGWARRTSLTTPTPGCGCECGESLADEMGRCLRWAAASVLDAERNQRQIMGY